MAVHVYNRVMPSEILDQPKSTEAPRSLDAHIEATPGVLGGRPRIAGTRIGVHHIAGHYYVDRWKPERIAEEFPTITLGDVFAALCYYVINRDEIDRQQAESDAFVKKFFEENPSKLKVMYEDAGETDPRGGPIDDGQDTK